MGSSVNIGAVSTLQRDLKQRRPFTSRETEAYLNLVRTTDLLSREVAAVLKPHQLSEAQYNVLRILRGAGPEGLACSEIGHRLVTRDPDVTRLLDRLETRALITRGREHPTAASSPPASPRPASRCSRHSICRCAGRSSRCSTTWAPGSSPR